MWKDMSYDPWYLFLLVEIRCFRTYHGIQIQFLDYIILQMGQVPRKQEKYYSMKYIEEMVKIGYI